MPTCKKCGLKFENRIKIEGVFRVVNRRKYCLSCSPFGLHNTRRIHLPLRKKRDRSHVYQKKIRTERKEKLVALKGGCCSRCGYKKLLDNLVFHHLDPSKKEFPLSCSFVSNRSWNALLKEVEKTECLCCNCHGEVHYELRHKKS